MPTITLPDGNNLNFPNQVTGLEVAEKISKSLAKQAMVIAINGELKDAPLNSCYILIRCMMSASKQFYGHIIEINLSICPFVPIWP